MQNRLYSEVNQADWVIQPKEIPPKVLELHTRLADDNTETVDQVITTTDQTITEHENSITNYMLQEQQNTTLQHIKCNAYQTVSDIVSDTHVTLFATKTLLPLSKFARDLHLKQKKSRFKFKFKTDQCMQFDADLQLGTERQKYSINDYANHLMTKLEISHELARSHLHRHAQRMKSWYDKRVKQHSFKVGQRVKLMNLRLYPGKTPKLTQKFTDIGIIDEKINDVTYRVTCDTWNNPKTKIVHVDKIREIYEFQLAETSHTAPDILDDSQ